MKKLTLILALSACILAVNAQRRLTFEEYDFTGGAIFQSVSDNAKYVAGYSSASYGGANTGFVYLVEEDTLICLNPEYEDNPEFSHLVSASAMDVSDAGIVVGRYTFSDAQSHESEPGFYNISTKEWTKLELPTEIDGKIDYENAVYGEATAISADGKYIAGYILMRMDNSTRGQLVSREVPCVWVRTNDDELNPEYKLQQPVDTDHTKILTQGDRAYRMSNDGRWLGGLGTNGFGCFNVMVWENHFNDSLLDRTILLGKEDIDRDGDTNGDGIVDDEDGGADGQYWWGGNVYCVSPSGEWICGESSYNGTGYADTELSAVGFRYNTITKVLEDSLISGIPFVIFDDGEMIFKQTGVTSSSVDKSVFCGTYAGDAGFGAMNFPMIILNNETAIENVTDLNVNLFVNNSTLFIEGEFTSVEVYSPLGALVGKYNANEISLDNMNKGIYVVRIINHNQATTKKINL
ncbi:MAG: T9SS type A sorting domain-containing protein [Paludibacteraceae bacterium]|nr:T9SS type A sorting domain-containing protein [Paludibacteraceae bacterium]